MSRIWAFPKDAVVSPPDDLYSGLQSDIFFVRRQNSPTPLQQEAGSVQRSWFQAGICHSGKPAILVF